MSIFSEIKDIKNLLDDANKLQAIRKVIANNKRKNVIVTDARRVKCADFDIAITCQDKVDEIIQDVSQVPDITISKITSSLIGVKCRRG